MGVASGCECGRAHSAGGRSSLLFDAASGAEFREKYVTFKKRIFKRKRGKKKAIKSERLKKSENRITYIIGTSVETARETFVRSAAYEYINVVVVSPVTDGHSCAAAAAVAAVTLCNEKNSSSFSTARRPGIG